MSGLFDTIVRRRRADASASSRGWPALNRDAAPVHGNGHAPEQRPTPVNGHRGSEVPAPAPETRAPEQPGPGEDPRQPGLVERARLRRRLRYLRSLREVQLRDIGGFLLELHRFDTQRADLVQAKLHGAAKTDAELRRLEDLLREPLGPSELRRAGIGGACPRCGAVHGSQDRFCATCGENLRHPAPPDPDGRSPGEGDQAFGPR